MMNRFLLAFLYAVLNATGASIIKHELVGLKLSSVQDYLRMFMSFKVILGFIIIFLSVLTIFKLLTISKLSFAVPVTTAFNFILTILYSNVFFHETITWRTLCGSSFILVGIIIYSFNNSN